MTLDNRTLGPEERMGEPEQDPRIDDIIDLSEQIVRLFHVSDILPHDDHTVLSFVRFCLENKIRRLTYESWKQFVQLNQE